MPNYDLHCQSCNKDHNIRASMAEKSEKRIQCPSCGSYDMETVYKSAPAYVKGGGKTPACPKRSTCGHACPHAG